MLHSALFLIAIAWIFLTLLDGFESILLPRRVSHRFRFARFYFRTGWNAWRRVAMALFAGKWREAMLGVFGPMSLLGLFGSWIASLILAFALLQWSLNGLAPNGMSGATLHRLTSYIYFSGTTYFTLGLGDVVPATRSSKLFTVIESGLGFGFLAIIISYLPVLYQAFSQREIMISLLDARAGSPPTGGEFLRRLSRDGRIQFDNASLREWEQWSAELLESHISFPILAYYRSQHANQSWLSALTTMLDGCALLMTLLPPADSHQAQLTFAMARHSAVDIALIFGIKPIPPATDRLAGRSSFITELLIDPTADQPQTQINIANFDVKFAELRSIYEPFIQALATHLVVTLPPVIAEEQPADNWQRSAWMPKTPGIGKLTPVDPKADHFD